MITDSYDIETEPMINLFDFYGRRGDFADICLIIFSKEIHRHLLDSYESEIIATMPACNGDTHIYKTTYKGVTITFYLSGIGSAVASSQCHLASWLTGASKFIMFGSCGSLDRTTTQGRFIIPTQSYRGDGCSYYFAAPSDYIDIAASKELSISTAMHPSSIRLRTSPFVSLIIESVVHILPVIYGTDNLSKIMESSLLAAISI